MDVLSDQDDNIVKFYQNNFHPSGNSYYKENEEVNPQSPLYFSDFNSKQLKTTTLNTVVKNKQLPLPDFIKMDVQGAEFDVLRGASEILPNVKHVILELQKVEYNKGAPLREHVIQYMDSIGFDCNGCFCDMGPDGDYHFVNRNK